MAAQNKPQAKPAYTVKHYKHRLQNRITWVLGFCVFIFLAVYLPRQVQEKFVKLFAEVKVNAGNFEFTNIGGFVTALCGLPLIFFLKWILFSQDHLATGNAETSRFFRHYYISSMLMKKYPELDQSQANKLWFDAFNKWQKSNATESEQDLFRRISERTYSLRLIWYLQRVCGYFAIGAVLMMAGECAFFHRPTFIEYMPVKLSILGFALIAWLWLSRSNTISAAETDVYYDKYTATGAYAKYKEMQGLAWEAFKEKVLAKWEKDREKQKAAGKH